MTELNWAQLAQSAELADKLPGEGPVLVRCEKAEWADTKTGKKMIVSDYLIVDGPDAGHTIRNWQTLSPESNIAVSIFMRYIRAHGVDPVQIGDSTRIALSLVGQVVAAEIEHDTYQGVKRPRLVGFAPATIPEQVANPVVQTAPQQQSMQPPPPIAQQMPPMAPQQQSMQMPPQAPQQTAVQAVDDELSKLAQQVPAAAQVFPQAQQ